jgi:hypothetical protein
MSDERRSQNSDERINKLSQRFKTHTVGRRPTTTRARERHSFYLDGDVVSRLDRTYREVDHALHPHDVSKSAFLETLIEYGLEHIGEIQALLHAQLERDDPAS